MFLVVVYAFAKWVKVAVTIWKLREIFVQPGLPDILVSDNGANFASEEFANFLRSSGIIHMKTAPH